MKPSQGTGSSAQDILPLTAGPHSVPPKIPDHELIRRIGGGSYGEVWLARNAMGTLRAVKVVYRASFEQDKPYEREFAGIQKFEPISRDHEGHVDILHVGRNQEAGYFYYIMELADESPVPAEQVAQYETRKGLSNIDPAFYVPRTLKSELRARGRLPVDECVSIGLPLTRAVAHLHQHGLVHRDIKPANIIFANGTPKLADIGLVTGIDATRSFVGTIGFIPPEGPGTPQADLYSLGKVLYEISTGKDREDFPQLPTDLRELPDANALVEFNEVLLKACHKDMRQRYASAEAMLADLELLQRGESVQSRRAWERRRALARNAGAAIGAFALVSLVALLVWTRLNLGHSARQANRLNSEGSYFLHKWSDSNDSSAIKLLEQAIALDPNSALAHARLAQAYAQKAFWGSEPNQHWQAKAAAEVEAALKLDPDCAEAFLARGKLLWSPLERFQHQRAVNDFKHALQIDAKLAEAYHQLALVYVHVGLFGKAAETSRKAQELDPLNSGARFRVGVAHLYEGNYKEALDIFNDVPRSFQPDLLATQTATALFYLKRTAEAKSVLQEYLAGHPNDALSQSTLAIVFAAEAQSTNARQAIHAAKENKKQYIGHYHHVSYNIASAYALMNEGAPALIFLREAADDGYPCYPRFQNDSNLDNLRLDPQFNSFMKELQQKFEQFQKTL
jgi:serine/threonine protein kinase/Flp pilus assembly protein TadD